MKIVFIVLILHNLLLVKHDNLIFFLYHLDLAFIQFTLFLLQSLEHLSINLGLFALLLQVLFLKFYALFLCLNLVELPSQFIYGLSSLLSVADRASSLPDRFNLLTHLSNDRLQLLILRGKLIDAKGFRVVLHTLTLGFKLQEVLLRVR